MCVVHVSPAGLSIYTRLWKPKNAYVVVFAKWCIYWEQDKLTALVFLGAVLGTSVTILILKSVSYGVRWWGACCTWYNINLHVIVGRCTDTASHSTLSLFCLPSLHIGTSYTPIKLTQRTSKLPGFYIHDFWLSRLEDHSNCNSEGTHPGSRWPPVELSHPIVIPCLSLSLVSL